MPLYEFQCKVCGHRFEKIQKFSDSPPSECPECGEDEIEQVIHAPAVQFKGSGWYVTDYAKKGNQSASGSKPESKSDSKTETKSSESKTEGPRKTEGKKD